MRQRWAYEFCKLVHFALSWYSLNEYYVRIMELQCACFMTIGKSRLKSSANRLKSFLKEIICKDTNGKIFIHNSGLFLLKLKTWNLN